MTWPDMAQIGFDNDPRVVGRWLEDAARAATRRDFAIPKDAEPATLYLWMNELAFNTDRWFLTPFAAGS
jgi:hypothetical protein